MQDIRFAAWAAISNVLCFAFQERRHQGPYDSEVWRWTQEPAKECWTKLEELCSLLLCSFLSFRFPWRGDEWFVYFQYKSPLLQRQSCTVDVGTRQGRPCQLKNRRDYLIGDLISVAAFSFQSHSGLHRLMIFSCEYLKMQAKDQYKNTISFIRQLLVNIASDLNHAVCKLHVSFFFIGVMLIPDLSNVQHELYIDLANHALPRAE